MKTMLYIHNLYINGTNNTYIDSVKPLTVCVMLNTKPCVTLNKMKLITSECKKVNF